MLVAVRKLWRLMSACTPPHDFVPLLLANGAHVARSLVCVSPIARDSKRKSIIAAAATDGSEHGINKEATDKVAFAWFCELTIDSESHKSYLELEEGWCCRHAHASDFGQTPDTSLSFKNLEKY